MQSWEVLVHLYYCDNISKFKLGLSMVIGVHILPENGKIALPMMSPHFVTITLGINVCWWVDASLRVTKHYLHANSWHFIMINQTKMITVFHKNCMWHKAINYPCMERSCWTSSGYVLFESYNFSQSDYLTIFCNIFGVLLRCHFMPVTPCLSVMIH